MYRPIFRFRNFRLDPASRQLWRDGERVPLPLKSFECLAYLIEHRERAVGRDELIAAVWGRAEVGDTLLGQTMLRARRAIGDSAGDHTAVRTITRFGYQWVAAVDVEMAAAEPIVAGSAEPGVEIPATADPVAIAEPSRAEPEPESASVAMLRRKSQRPLLLLACGLLLAIVVLMVGAHYWPVKPLPVPSPTSDRLVLVLPVTGIQASEESWIRLGAMDYLASRLRGAKGLQVLPSEQTVALLGHDESAPMQHDVEDLHRFEQATGATYILSPRATHTGGSWNLTLDVYHDHGITSFEAQAPTGLEAAAQVANRFLDSIGLKSAAAFEPPSTPDEYLQRIDAALLAGDLVQARGLADAAPAELKSDPAFVVRAARIAFRHGEADRAEQMLRPLEREDATTPATVRVRALLSLGAIAIYRQDFDAADRYYTSAFAALGEHGDPALLGKAHTDRGLVNGVLQHIDAAMADFARARVELDRAGDRLGMANLDTNVGLVETVRDRYAEALSAYDSAVTIFARFGVTDNLVIALQGKTYVQRMLLDFDGAFASSEREGALAQHLDNPSVVRRVALSRVPVLLATGHLKQAAEAIDPYVPIVDPGKPQQDPAFAVLRARLLVEQGKPEEALHGADAVLDAIEGATNPNSEIYLSGAVEVFVTAALHAGQVAQAEHLLNRLQSAREVVQDEGRPLVIEACLAKVLAARGDPTASDHFAKSLSLANSGEPETIVAVNAAYADYLSDRRGLGDVTAVIGRLLPYADRDYRAARAVSLLYAALGDHERAATATATARRLAGERLPKSS